MRVPKRFRLALAVPWIVATSAALAAGADPCRSDAFEDASYTVCSVDPDASDLRMFWRNERGEPHRTFGALSEDLAEQGLRLTFATNGGMYQRDFSPVGLYVERGEELAPPNTLSVNTRPEPNFYKKPNGIFFVGPDGAGVMETTRYVERRPTSDFATQSGPMLIIDGALHPAFIPGSTARQRRNGVGVCGGEVHFVISESLVNFDEFGRFFRDRLGCADALFLDGGSAPGIYAPRLGRNDPPGHGGYGPIIGIVAPM